MRYRRGRKKNDEMFNITILDPAMKIIEKYGGVPMMDEHVYNRYLKDVACLCGISKRISTHCGRVTYASTVMLANGVSLKVLSNAMDQLSPAKCSDNHLQERRGDLDFDTSVKYCGYGRTPDA